MRECHRQSDFYHVTVRIAPCEYVPAWSIGSSSTPPRGLQVPAKSCCRRAMAMARQLHPHYLASNRRNRPDLAHWAGLPARSIAWPIRPITPNRLTDRSRWARIVSFARVCCTALSAGVVRCWAHLNYYTALLRTRVYVCTLLRVSSICSFVPNRYTAPVSLQLSYKVSAIYRCSRRRGIGWPLKSCACGWSDSVP